MKKIIAFLSLVFCLQARAQTWVTIPDVQFYYALQGVIPAALNGNQQLNISSSLVTTRDTLFLNNKSISNLSGIQYFSSLKYLDCSLNSLTSILSLPNTITYLDCSNNFILTNLPVSLPASLTQFFCYNNPLVKTLPILPNSLIYFRCDGDSLMSLPTLPNSLQTLYCFNNFINCFPNFPISITDIDIDPNPYNCLPNYISAMNATQLAMPLCAAANSNGCPLAGINQIADLNNQVTIYPNPTSTNFTIETNSTDKQTLQTFDVNGKLVLSQIINGKTNIDASNLAEGVYNLSLINQNDVVNKRLVVVR